MARVLYDGLVEYDDGQSLFGIVALKLEHEED